MYVCIYIKRFHFICKILFFSFSLFFFPTENDGEVKGENKLHLQFPKWFSLSAEDGPRALSAPGRTLQEEGI